ncbi:transposase [Cohaesibacter sp. ES.047]|uniref:transposase n=1 Tax=Cohaesibacter sp. ES.047 TaxID=1798205 RepID=UPI000BB70830|nr:transposase [Cohaesibacter sp. ES.047]SNY92285.1 transposase [Cohaesibacter sp. ES.047]
MESTTEFLTPVARVRGRPRKWTDEEKAQIVPESLRPGARAHEVAEQYGVRPNHLSSWRTAARRGKLVLPEPEGEIRFASLVVEDASAPEPRVIADRPEIHCGSITIRLEAGASVSRIAAVARSLARTS